MSFVPGKSGNPNGRPKKKMALTNVLEKLLEIKDIEHETADGETILIRRKEAIAKKIIELAVTGDVVAIKYIFDRVDGPPKQSMEISNVYPPEIIIEVDNDDTLPA
jgi:hypothetical protein